MRLQSTLRLESASTTAPQVLQNDYLTQLPRHFGIADQSGKLATPWRGLETNRTGCFSQLFNTHIGNGDNRTESLWLRHVANGSYKCARSR